MIIAVWNQLGYTRLTVESVLKNTAPPFELIVVDNGSRPDVRAYFDSIKDKVGINYIRNEENLGPIRAINQGIKVSRYNYIAVIHNDVIILEKGWLEKIVSFMEKDPEIGIVGLAGRKEIHRGGNVNEASLKHNLQNEDLNPPMKEEISEVAVVDGLCFIMRRQLLDTIKGFDETYGYMHCYDLDISLQSIEAGFKNVVVKVEAMHIGNGGRTRKSREYKELVKDDYGLLKRNCKILARKWRHMLPITKGNPIVDLDLYSKDYFLTDNEGWREYIDGLDRNIHPKFAMAMKLANPAEGDTVLDIGCGRGELLYYCAKRGAKVLGIDYSKTAVEIAKETIKRLPSDIRYFARVDIGDIVTYNFQEKYNIIFMVETLEHMHDWQLLGALKKINEILSNEGRVIIITPNYYYEKYLAPIKRATNMPWNLIKWPLRILRGKYKPKGIGEVLHKVFKIKIDRGELNKMVHVNVSTPGKLRRLLYNFDADIRCEDHSKNIISLFTQKWWGRDIVAIVKKKRGISKTYQ